MTPRDDAEACLSLAYKYPSLRACVKGQRPQLLLRDPVLQTLEIQIEALTDAFEERVIKLAHNPDESEE